MSEIAVQETTNKMSRMDKSIAENLKDIEKTFKQDAPLVYDLIAFISNRMYDLFGYAKFTLNEFCAEMGRNKQDLCMLHPLIAAGVEEAPERNGHKFQTVFDFVLYRILERKIIFSESYAYAKDGIELYLESFEILKDIKINMRKSNNLLKIYDVRVSDDLMNGFLQRYYYFDLYGFKMLSKGRGAFGKKKLYTAINQYRHIILTTGKTTFTDRIPVNYLAGIADIDAKENKSRKLSLKRYLTFIQERCNIRFKFEFVNSGRNKYEENYFVVFEFDPCEITLVKNNKEHYILLTIWKNLRLQYNAKYKNLQIPDEKDPFQRWLNNNDRDLKDKIYIIIQAYSRESISIDEKEAMRLIFNKKIGSIN